MELSRPEKTRLGIFIGILIVLLISSTLYLITRHLLSQDDAYRTSFSESVDGLINGAPVKLRGVEVGRVDALSVDPNDVTKVIVEFSVKKGTVLKQDMVCELTGGLSITGLKNIEISGGTQSAQNLVAGSILPSRPSALGKLSGQAEQITLKFEQLLNHLLALSSKENQEQVFKTLSSWGSVATMIDTIMHNQNGPLNVLPGEIQKTLVEVQQLSKVSRELIESISKENPGNKIGATLTSLQHVSKDLEIGLREANLGKNLGKAGIAADQVATTARSFDATLRLIQEDLGHTLAKLKSASDNMDDFSRIIRENPSLLLRTEEKKERDAR